MSVSDQLCIGHEDAQIDMALWFRHVRVFSSTNTSKFTSNKSTILPQCSRRSPIRLVGMPKSECVMVKGVFGSVVLSVFMSFAIVKWKQTYLYSFLVMVPLTLLATGGIMFSDCVSVCLCMHSRSV